ncbi:Lactoylglutathione lyase [Friedmanniomyces endolithicus]|uniref:Lactoylglutathione lyase n=1 Tax=Friedmanniomyces endolithicus TaxID=329885 RepID=A0AAN6KRS9_9PEZI|nr:Lactoylglutathione lyase [Friedmanniomyces endolithicus]KAK0988309.1 Lactoylglutathione lyase [Friedmanniomyces endolithicus]KAK0997083.1 Lactoylglutathione lyase [Friedmanniomyces endolithicus]
MTDPSKYLFNHTMLRVKDPKKSVAFYEHLGMSLVNKLTFPENKFDLYFLAYDGPKSASPKAHWTNRQGLIELTHNHGTETDDSYHPHNGNKEPQGFGHVCVAVDNIQAACQRIEDAGYRFQKKLSDGRMRHIAFALDPDDYWVEIIAQNPVDETEKVKETDVTTYRMNHTMVRVKDQKKSLDFYQEVMGMRLLRTHENEAAKFNLYFLGYGPEAGDKSANGVNPTAERGGVVGIDVELRDGREGGEACERMEEKGVEWKKRLTDGRMKNVAFVLDPDGYWIEIIQNENYKEGSKY